MTDMKAPTDALLRVPGNYDNNEPKQTLILAVFTRKIFVLVSAKCMTPVYGFVFTSNYRPYHYTHTHTQTEKAIRIALGLMLTLQNFLSLFVG